MRIIHQFALFNGEVLTQVKQDSPVILGTHLLSLLFLIVGFILIVATIRTKKRVMEKHLADMAILEDWDRAVRLTYSGNEAEILIALDIIWALSNPLTYAEVLPIVNLFLTHTNTDISMRAQRIIDKQSTWITPLSTAT